MGNGVDEPIRPMRPVDTIERLSGPRSTTGRSFAIGVGLLSSFVSALAVAAWVHDLGKQVPCAPSDAPLFDIPTVGVILTVVLLLGGMAVVVVSQWRKPHRIAATIGAAILATSLLWILAAVAFRHGNVSACFPAF